MRSCWVWQRDHCGCIYEAKVFGDVSEVVEGYLSHVGCKS